MTEEEWLTSEDAVRLLCGLNGRIVNRKIVLFELAVAERLIPLSSNRVFAEWSDYVFARVDGHQFDSDRHERLVWDMASVSHDALSTLQGTLAEHGPDHEATARAMQKHLGVSILMYSQDARGWWEWLESFAETLHAPGSVDDLTRVAIADVYSRCLPLLRCIVGNPFRPVAFAPQWRSPTTLALAEAIYADRAFDRLPILADALEEAGCDHPDVLAHCRGPGPHARGCWVVDMILGKT